MKISILGAGNIGGTLGKKWAQAGHHVLFGVRDAHSAKAKALRGLYPAAQLVSLADAANFGEAILISTPYASVAALAQTHSVALVNKIIFDATNNFNGPVVNNVQTIHSAAPTATIFRAFNSLGWEHFANPQLNGTQIDHFYCGPDNQARASVDQLIAEIGVRPIWLGDHDMLPVADALGTLWVRLAFQRGYGRTIALKLLQ